MSIFDRCEVVYLFISCILVTYEVLIIPHIIYNIYNKNKCQRTITGCEISNLYNIDIKMSG